MVRYFKTVYHIIEKDLLLELKSKEVINSMLIFALLVVVVFSFIFEPGAEYKNDLAAGILWMSIIFSGILGLNKSMMNEINGGNLNALLLAPVDKSAIFFGKGLSNFLFMLIMEVIIIPIFVVFYDVPIMNNLLFSIITLLLGTYGFAILGTLFSIISVKSKTREVMLPILLLPIIIPVVLSAIQAMNIFLKGDDISESFKWLQLLLVFDIVFTLVIYVIFDFVIEE
ncbi:MULTISPECIES: heme exporter protein CcmB [Calditerrivibrio]|jgi:heme exporter protein B|uniref:Heme exporter protein B n=1 Tax=Calditerrivibrio nitroreducens TaxID=477976 RepID=A0A2J6WND1_9BACT|nr:MAG: cytochrome C biogenesis protein [Calditerrivibrio nitroreducens]